MAVQVASPVIATKSLPRTPVLTTLGDVRKLQHDILGTLMDLARRGDVANFPLMPHAFFINSPALIYATLVEESASVGRSAFDRKLMRPLLGDGLVTTVGEKHKRQRKLLAPAFSRKHVAAYGDAMVRCAGGAQQRWAAGDVIDIHQEMVRLTTAIIEETIFGAHFQDDDFALVQASVTAISHYILARGRSVVHMPLSLPTPNNIGYRQALRRLDGAVYRLIAARRAMPGERDDILSILLRTRDDDGAFMDDRQIRDEMVTLFQAGHDATANALSWTLYLLMRHPEYYDRVCAEVDAALGGRPATAADLANLPYTLQVVKESLRLYPPQWIQNRQVQQPITIDGYHFPAGSWLLFSPYTLHRRPDTFPDPERFDPERFTPEAERELPRLAYMPFASGPRICIGNHFAMLELHLLIATLTQHARFQMVDDAPVPHSTLLSLRPGKPMRAQVTRRG